MRLEASFGIPFDIEWMIADDQIYILQVRPIAGTGDGQQQTPNETAR